MVQAQFRAYANLFQRVHDAGLTITCHASEDAKEGLPQNAIDAVELLHASRIGHGIQIFKSQEAMDYIRDRQILLEVSVSSNYLTSAVPEIDLHPVKKLYDAGIKVSVNTDDPGIMNLTLPGEYQIWHDTLGFSQQQLYDMNILALDESFIPESRKAGIRQRYFRACI